MTAVPAVAEAAVHQADVMPGMAQEGAAIATTATTRAATMTATMAAMPTATMAAMPTTTMAATPTATMVATPTATLAATTTASTTTPTRETTARKSYPSGGATTWNRKEGGRSRPTLLSIDVREPLAPLQEEILVRCLMNCSQQLTHQGLLTITSLAKKVQQMWNMLHYQSLSSGGDGVGGLLPFEIAKSRVKCMTERATRGHLNPLNDTSLLPLMNMIPVQPFSTVELARAPMLARQSQPSMVPIVPRPRHDSLAILAAERPRSEKAKILKPLEELTLDELPYLTSRVLADYCHKIGKGMPPDKDERLRIVREKLQEIRRQQKQSSGERRTSK